MSRGLQDTLIVIGLLLLGVVSAVGVAAWVQAASEMGVFATVEQRVVAVFIGFLGSCVGGGAGAIIVAIRRGGM
jgi:hypothetical protein